MIVGVPPVMGTVMVVGSGRGPYETSSDQYTFAGPTTTEPGLVCPVASAVGVPPPRGSFMTELLVVQ